MSRYCILVLHQALNVAPGFVFALAISVGLIRLFRMPDGWAKIGFLGLPWLKLLFDLSKGVGDNAFLWAHLAGLTRDVGTLTIGLGVTAPAIVKLMICCEAVVGASKFSLGAGDASIVVMDRVSPLVAVTLGGAIALISLAKIGAWAASNVRLARWKIQLTAGAVPWGRRSNGKRMIAVFRCADVRVGPVPFICGWVSPIICFPETTFQALSVDQREAVIAHELAHTRRYDAILDGIQGLLQAAFWFLPGTRWLGGAVTSMQERLADDDAVRAGIDRIVLADALVAVAQHRAASSADPSVVAPVAAARSGLSLRIARLLSSSAASPRLGWSHRWLRVVIAALIVPLVIAAHVLGNT